MPDTAQATSLTHRGAQAATRPRLSVIVPVHNGALQLSRCLEALRLSEHDGFEVIVVDDCSTDNTPRIIERFGARYLRTPRNLGPGGARNLGVEHAAGEIVVFVDADVVVPPEALRLIAEGFDREPQLAAMFGSYDDQPAWGDFLSQYKNLMHHYVHQVSSERAVTFWAGCGAMRKDVFRHFGGFDTLRYPNPSIEDIELGYRLTQAGYPIRLNKQLRVKHLKKWTVRGLLRADILYRAVPWANLIFQTRHLPRDLNLTYASQLSAALTGLLFLAIVTGVLRAVGVFSSLPGSLFLAGVAIPTLVLLALNWRVYAWFRERRGAWFTAGAVLAHWFYYFYSGMVFALCWVWHFVRAPFRLPRPAAPGRGPEQGAGS